MVFSAGRVKSSLLAVALLVSGQSVAIMYSGANGAATPSYMERVASLMPLNRKQFIGVLLFAMYSRLKTKGSSGYKYYEDTTLREDIKHYLETLSFEDLKELFDKWIIGRAISVADTVYVLEEGISSTRAKGKKLLAKPFGLLGLFEAYVLQVLKPLAEVTENITKIAKLSPAYFDIDLV